MVHNHQNYLYRICYVIINKKVSAWNNFEVMKCYWIGETLYELLLINMGHDQLLEICLLKKSARQRSSNNYFYLVNWSTAVLKLLSCRINWIRAIDIIIVNCSKCRPLNIRTVDTNIKTDINFVRIAINRQHVRQELVKKMVNMYGS